LANDYPYVAREKAEIDVTAIRLLFGRVKGVRCQVVRSDRRVDISAEHHAGVWSSPVLIGVGATVLCLDVHFPHRGIEMASFAVINTDTFR
jgi:hypothetical protein